MNPTVITLCFLAFAVIMFVLEKIPLGLTATIVSVGLCVTGVLEPKQAFAGYVDSNVILCVAMFVVGQALFETGMANKIGGLVTKFAKSERQLIIAIMVITGLMSGFLSNTGSAAVLIPVVVGIAAAWCGASLFQVSVACCAVVFVIELFLVRAALSGPA